MKIEEGTARKEWTCNFADCRKKIKKGETYFLWHIAPGYMAQRQHTEHGQPTVKPATKKATKTATKKMATKKKTTKKIGQKRKKGEK